jgi:hypothetical protein
LYCTTDDICTEGACVGAGRICEDGVTCNGLSECDEGNDTCTAGANQCAEGEICDSASDTCVSTCAGCVIEETCIADNVVDVRNPCVACIPGLSRTAYSPVVGKSCGSGPGTCSGQDTCDASGLCQPNHDAAGVPCGNNASNACDQPDTCNGNGFCQQRLIDNGIACNDGLFCSVGDECQGGSCVSTGLRNCGAGRTCNEPTDECRCSGCDIGGACVGNGAVNPSNTCQVCDVGRSRTGFSTNDCAALGRVCAANGTCACPASQVDVAGTCRLRDGQPCQADASCASGVCTAMFRDIDADTYGDPSAQRRECGTAVALGFVSRGGDCCDSAPDLAVAARVFPGQTAFFPVAAAGCPNGFDYNCDGSLEPSRQLFDGCAGTDARSCSASNGWDAFPIPDCGDEDILVGCDFISQCSAFSRAPAVQNCR